MAAQIIETCPLCNQPTKDGRLTCDCDSGCEGCQETPGARAGGLDPHFGCMCECHYPLARAMAEREAGGRLCGECGMRLFDGVCANEGGCSRYCPTDYDDWPEQCAYSYHDVPCSNQIAYGSDYCAAHNTCENRSYQCCENMTSAQHHREFGTWPYGERPSAIEEPMLKLLDFRTHWLRPKIHEAMAELGMPTAGVAVLDLDDVPF